MRPACPAFATLALGAVFVFLVSLAAAQDGVQSNAPGAGFDTPGSSAPTLHVYSRETIVDVLVTDDKGQPVTGLKQSDFTVKEDGNLQPIRSFHEYDKSAPPAPPEALPPDTYTNATTLPATGPVQIILFDLLGTPPNLMERTKAYVADYLRNMPAGTQVALFEFSARKGVSLLQGFTSDAHVAAAAVDKLDVEGIHDPVYGCPIALAGFNQIAAYAAGIHGRKNLIWITPHIPRCVMIDRDGGYAVEHGLERPDPPDMTVVHNLIDLYDRFTREQIAIYPLDPRGVHETTIMDRVLTLRDQHVPDDTGGAMIISNDFKAIVANIVDSTSHFYTLSYVPPRPDVDGHFHPITITVNRPGLHLNYRRGYNDEQPLTLSAAVIHDVIQGPMRLGAMPATQLLFTMSVQPAVESSPTPSGLKPASTQPPAPHTKGLPYDALFQLDPTQFAYTDEPDGKRTCSLEFDLGAYDGFSDLVSVRSQTLKITVTPAQYAVFTHKPYTFTLPIDLPPGQLNLRAGVFDTSANKAGTLEVPITVPKR
jgi:VWFA-related protein